MLYSLHDSRISRTANKIIYHFRVVDRVRLGYLTARHDQSIFPITFFNHGSHRHGTGLRKTRFSHLAGCENLSIEHGNKGRASPSTRANTLIRSTIYSSDFRHRLRRSAAHGKCENEHTVSNANNVPAPSHRVMKRKSRRTKLLSQYVVL